MPFHIDAFKSSPGVRAMHPAARSGYLYLLAYAWQTDDCSIPSDPLELAEISELGDELWQTYGPRILRKFTTIEATGRLQNEKLLEEWNEAKRVFDARSLGGKRKDSSKTPERVIEVTPPQEQEHRQEQKQEQKAEKPFARSVPPEQLAGTLPLANGTDFQVSKSDVSRWVQAFPGVDVKQELKKFKAWCEDNPTRKKTAKGVKGAVFRWLDRAQNNGGGANGRQDQKRTQGNAGAQVGEDGPDLYEALYGKVEQGKPN